MNLLIIFALLVSAQNASAESIGLDPSQADVVFNAKQTAAQKQILGSDDVEIDTDECVVDIVDQAKGKGEIYCSFTKDITKGYLIISVDVYGNLFRLENPVVKKILLPM